MGDMADQYSDGRYDPGRHVPGGILSPWDSRGAGRPSPDLVAFMAANLSVERGGIKYPSPKGNAVPKNSNTQAEAWAVAAAAKRMAAEGLLAEAEALDAKVKKARRPEPPKGQDRWAIDVRFTKGGKLYQFLVLRAGRSYYTTGTHKHSYFPDWEAFLAWLDLETASHSSMIPLMLNLQSAPALDGKR